MDLLLAYFLKKKLKMETRMILINFLIPIVPAEEIIPKASDRTTAGNNSDKNT